MPSEMAKLLKERRLTRMRMGQAAYEIAELPSDSEIRVALVPLLEEEYEMGLSAAASLNTPETMAGLAHRERYKMLHDLWMSARSPDNVEQRMFESPEEMKSALEVSDLNYLSQVYVEMTDRSSPTLDGLSDEDLDELKKAFNEIQWSELSGRQWAVVKNCLLNLLPEQLAAKLFGSTSTNGSITTSDEPTPITSAGTN